jgi:hypothetical protein
VADPNQTPQRGNWVCPCNGCKKAAKQVVDQIVEEYKSCPNIVESEDKLFCSTWWRHDDCERLMNLLNKITKDDKYSIPPVRQEVSEAVDKMLTDPNTLDILRRLKD